MPHLPTQKGRAWERAARVLPVLVLAISTLWATSLTSQWLTGETQDGNLPELLVSTRESPVLYSPAYEEFPVPSRVAESQHFPVAKAKHPDPVANPESHNRRSEGMTRRLIAGLMLLQAAHSGHGR